MRAPQRVTSRLSAEALRAEPAAAAMNFLQPICSLDSKSPWGAGLLAEKGMAMPYEEERGGSAKWLALVLTIIIVGGAIYWGIAASG